MHISLCICKAVESHPTVFNRHFWQTPFINGLSVGLSIWPILIKIMYLFPSFLYLHFLPEMLTKRINSCCKRYHILKAFILGRIQLNKQKAATSTFRPDYLFEVNQEVSARSSCGFKIYKLNIAVIWSRL